MEINAALVSIKDLRQTILTIQTTFLIHISGLIIIFFGLLSQSPVVSRTQLTQQQQQQLHHQDRKFDLLRDLGGDIFAAQHSQSTGNANFANFAHFNSHSGKNTLALH